jgi:hypothetical protein
MKIMVDALPKKWVMQVTGRTECRVIGVPFFFTLLGAKERLRE